ncbi:MAG: type IV secretion system DNA-binding domain-containing protein [Candidatus Paceibacterota bacterium]|jgi:hypothetical protein
MKDPTILRLRFPFNDNASGVAERVKKFEALLYNAYFLLTNTENVISFEIAVVRGSFNFYIVAPEAISQSIVSLVFAELPETEVTVVPNYLGADQFPNMTIAMEPHLVGSQTFSLRTVSGMKTDPLNPLFNIFSSVAYNGALLYQIILRPLDDVFGDIGKSSGYDTAEKLEAEALRPRFKVAMRLLCLTEQEENVWRIASLVENAFSPFSTEKNYFKVEVLEDAGAAWDAYFDHQIKSAHTSVLNNIEIAALFHYPDPVAKISGIDWLYARKAEPPIMLPSLENTEPGEVSIFATTNFRGEQTRFGILREDRRRHLYIVGKSGYGKSKLLEKLINADIHTGKGVCVIDPHGDLVQDIIKSVPEDRMDDVIYFDPSDLEYPISFNPLENVAREFRQQVAQGLIEIFKKFFGADWTPKIEHVFRFTVLALLDHKNSSIIGLQSMLTDRSYRQEVVEDIKDHIVKKFWSTEFAGWSEKYDNEAITPLVNKLGQFLSNEMVRNIVGQSRNKINFDDIMNKGKVLLIELSKGKLGTENASLLGSLIITKIEQEGMARAALPKEKRQDFYLYVDEFQNFATQSFDNILAESRKYGLNLSLSHQYLGQLGKTTRDTIFGNVSSLISFRLSADDAKYMAEEMMPWFTANDIMSLGVREIYLKMSIHGSFAPPFSARTADMDQYVEKAGAAAEIKKMSRERYCTPIAEVEAEIKKIYGGKATVSKKAEESFEAPII